MRAQAASIQSSEIEASKLRMEELEEIDRKRQDTNAQEALERSERERMILTYAFIATIGVLLLILIVGLVILI